MVLIRSEICILMILAFIENLTKLFIKKCTYFLNHYIFLFLDFRIWDHTSFKENIDYNNI